MQVANSIFTELQIVSAVRAQLSWTHLKSLLFIFFSSLLPPLSAEASAQAEQFSILTHSTYNTSPFKYLPSG